MYVIYNNNPIIYIILYIFDNLNVDLFISLSVTHSHIIQN